MRRSMLFVPGNNPKMMTSCGFFGADAVIFDLEDAVSPQEKDAARRLVHYALTNLVLGATESIVRVNSTDTAMFRPDLEQIVPQKPSMIMLPKTSCAEDVLTLARELDRLECEHGMEPGSIGVIALIETALGVENAYAIATASPRVRALFLGGEDLSADLRCKRTKESREIFYARTRLVMAARAAVSMSMTRRLPTWTTTRACAPTRSLQRASALRARHPFRRAISRVSTPASAPRRPRRITHVRSLRPSRKACGRARARSRCAAK